MKISVQLYTVREEMDKDAGATLSAISDMGFRYVETAGYAGRSVNEFAELLTRQNLKVSGMHVGLGEAESSIDRLLEEATLLECPYIIVPWVSESDYADGFGPLAARLEAVGQAVREAGRSFAYHNHVFEFLDHSGEVGYDVIFGQTSADSVFNQIDLWWAHCGGRNVPEMIDIFGERVRLVHLKDGCECNSPVQIEAGLGVMDWDPILRACDRVGVDYGVIELDNCPNPPLESVRRSLDFFRSKGYLD